MEENVTIELPVSDVHTVLSVLKVAIQEGVGDEERGDAFVEDLTRLYTEMNQQLEAVDGEGHVHGLYDDRDDA